MIMAMFHKEDAEVICRIPLSRRSVPDFIIWLHNKNGKFSVKFAYKLARRTQFHGDRAKASSGCAGKKFGRFCGSLKLKIKLKYLGGELAMIYYQHTTICHVGGS